jgi:hypothetical protein
MTCRSGQPRRASCRGGKPCGMPPPMRVWVPLAGGGHGAVFFPVEEIPVLPRVSEVQQCP